ncbi:MAG: type III-A CRISPR-associated protein Cas10/Csm1 [Planctomycetota bacterium]
MKDVIEVGLAGLLHDWGKLFQRARTPLSAQGQRMAEMLCPRRDDGGHSHQHVLWTNDVLEQQLGWLPAELEKSRITALASNHHRPSEEQDYLVAEADRLASGHDRRERAEESVSFRKVPLRSIFDSLQLGRAPVPTAAALPPRELQPDDSLFPEKVDEPRSLETDYAAVADQLLRRIAQWQDVPLGRVADALTTLSHQLLARVPASTIDAVPDVSLHDHSTLVAALAATLYRFHSQAGTLTEAAIMDRDTSKFLLVSGDLSGIQAYLLERPAESRKGLACTYRARSFFLSMLTHAATLKLLSAAGLPSFNRVLDAGGRFVLLLPATEDARAAITQTRRSIDEWVLGQFGGRLTLNIDDGVCVPGRAFLGARFRTLYWRLQRAAETAKRRKLAAWLVSEQGWAEDRQPHRYEHTQQRQERDLERDKKLGAKLPDAHFVGLWSHAPPRGLLPEPVNVFDYQLQLFADEPDRASIAAAADFFRLSVAASGTSWIPVRSRANYIPRLQPADVETLTRQRVAREEATGDEDEEEPLQAGQLATFGRLSYLARRPKSHNPGFEGFAGIACLKADADRLGMLLSHGFRDQVSFGRIATLSRQLDFFFKDYLGARLSDAAGPFRLVYTVFSGGDDLMLVGPWPVMLDLARDLHDWFTRLTTGHPDATLSAGIALGHARMPISALATAAETMLTSAKDAGRNRIGIFGAVHTWDEYRRGLEVGQWLDARIGSGDNRSQLALNTAFVYRLLQYARSAARVRQAQHAEQRHQAGEVLSPTTVRLADLENEFKWRSHLAYDIHRNLEQRIPHDAAGARGDVDQLRSLLPVELRTSMSPDVLKLAATYALYRNRGG